MRNPDYNGTTHSEELFVPRQPGSMMKQEVAVISPLFNDMSTKDLKIQQDLVPIYDEGHDGDRTLFFDGWMDVDEADKDLPSNPNVSMTGYNDYSSSGSAHQWEAFPIGDIADSSDNDRIDHTIETPKTIAEDAMDISSEPGYDVRGHFRGDVQSDASDPCDDAIEPDTVCPSKIYREEDETTPSSGDEFEEEDQHESFAQTEDGSYVSNHTQKTNARPQKRQKTSSSQTIRDWQKALEVLKQKLPDEELSLSRTSDGRRLVIAQPQTSKRLIITNPSGTRTYYATPTLGLTISEDEAIATKVLSVRIYNDEVKTEDGALEQAFLPGEHLINLDLVENSLDRKQQLGRDGAELRYVTEMIASLEDNRQSELYLRDWSFAEAMDMWRESIRESVGDWELGEGWSANYEKPVWFEQDNDTHYCETLP